MRSAPWQVKGVAPAARETAHEAARRSGLSVGEWLNTVIFGSAGKQPLPQRQRPPYRIGRNISSIHARLDNLTRQIDRLAETSSPALDAYGEETPRRLADAIDRLDRRLDQLIQEGRQVTSEMERRVSSVDRALAALGEERLRTAFVGGPESLDQAVAEITARQRVLDGTPAGPEAFAPPPRFASAPAAPQRSEPDLSGLEQQLRHITTQIELMQRPCGIDEALTVLRQDLAEIGRTLSEAMPRRALEALESEVHKLAAQVDATRQTVAGGSATASLERGLVEVRDALRALTPAESLIGFDEAVKSLSRKVDMLAGGGADPAVFQQLESAIGSLRGIVSHVASGEAVAALAADVRKLANRIEQSSVPPANDALMTLERRIEAITDAIEATRAEGSGAVPPALDALMRSLSDKLETLQLTRTDQLALGNLEERITRLVEKLDASEAKLGHLGAIERGMAELLVHLEKLRAAQGAKASDGAAVSAPSPAPAVAPPPVETLTRDVAEMKQTRSAIGRRTEDSLEEVQGTIGDVVSRLAMIESDLRSETKLSASPAPEMHLPGAAPAPSTAAASSPVTARAGDPASGPVPAARPKPHAPPRQPIDPTLPPDYPLEPGSGAPRIGTSAADRIAASEAPLRAARSGTQAADDSDPSNFLQAARRAARAAANGSEANGADRDGASELDGTAKTLSDRLKKLFVGASVVLAVAATFRFAGIYLDPERVILADAPAAPNDVAQLPPALPTGLPPGLPATARAFAVPEDLLMTADKAAGAPKTPTTVALAVPAAGPAPVPAPQSSNPVAPPPASAATAAGQAMPAEITGSVPSKQQPAAKPAASEAPPPASDQPPQGLSKALVAAAASGDPVAAHEIATRYAEGRGVAQSYKEAVVWYERAAKRGLAPAQFRLGTMYEKGLGVGKDLQEARRLYLAAADKGNAKAMHNIAVLYAEGIDGKPDYKTAVQWFRKAANYGVADSQYNLAILCARGIGVEQSLTEAFKWFALAANTGDQEAAKKRDDIAARLDKPSLVAARLAVKSFAVTVAPEEATTVKTPPGGWDQAAVPASTTASATPAGRARPHSRATSGSGRSR